MINIPYHGFEMNAFFDFPAPVAGLFYYDLSSIFLRLRRGCLHYFEFGLFT